MVNFTAADRVGSIGGYIGGIGTLLGGRNGLFGRGWDDGERRGEWHEDEGGGKYRHRVTEHELELVQHNNALLAENSTLKSEKYTDYKTERVEEGLEKMIGRLGDRICDLEKYIAVNDAHDRDFRHYADREFVHQPKASIRESIVVCRQCGCRCSCEDVDEFRGREHDRDRHHEREDERKGK